jgi:hypothetical protein
MFLRVLHILCIHVCVYRVRILSFRQTVRLHFLSLLRNDTINFVLEVGGVGDTFTGE